MASALNISKKRKFIADGVFQVGVVCARRCSRRRLERLEAVEFR
jgi:hypothetical protein